MVISFVVKLFNICVVTKLSKNALNSNRKPAKLYAHEC
jgi:hypothetical protein